MTLLNRQALHALWASLPNSTTSQYPNFPHTRKRTLSKSVQEPFLQQELQQSAAKSEEDKKNLEDLRLAMADDAARAQSQGEHLQRQQTATILGLQAVSMGSKCEWLCLHAEALCT